MIGIWIALAISHRRHSRRIEEIGMPYRPLPDCLTIAPSGIGGLGLFATKPIAAKTNLGVTHIGGETARLVLTPLGGFINHVDEPNCYKRTGTFGKYELVTTEPIEAGTELTLSHTLVEPPRTVTLGPELKVNDGGNHLIPRRPAVYRAEKAAEWAEWEASQA